MIFYFYRYSDVKRIKVDENIEIKIKYYSLMIFSDIFLPLSNLILSK